MWSNFDCGEISMPHFAANLTMLFNEVSFLDRFKEAADQGFRAVELLFPYKFDVQDIKQRLHENNLELVLFNMPPGDWDAGDRGMAAIPEKKNAFKESVSIALSYAIELSCDRLHVMAGLGPETANLLDMKNCYIENLQYAADKCAEHDITIMIEPLNNRDVPEYFLKNTDQARQIIQQVDRPNIGLQLDFYHLQITEGDLERKFQALLDITDHIQIAGVPGRHEPSIGEINYTHIFKLIDQSKYEGWIGCEYKPKTSTKGGLDWLKSMT